MPKSAKNSKNETKAPSRIKKHAKTVRHHYEKRMPAKKSHRVMIWVAFFCVVSTIAVQMLYPLDRATPLSRINDQFVGFDSEADLAKKLNDTFSSATVEYKYEGKKTSTSLSKLGAEPKTQAMIDDLTSYPYWQRFIPGSMFWQLNHIETLEVDFNRNVLKNYSDSLAKSITTQPKNAGLAIKDGELIATDEVPGYSVSTDQVIKSTRDASYYLAKKTVIKLKLTKVEPKMTVHNFLDVKQKAQSAISRNLTIQTDDGQIFEPTKSDKASWLIISNKDNQPSLSIDTEKLKKYIKSLDSKIGKPAGETRVDLRDGREVARDEGAAGKKIDVDRLVPEIETHLLEVAGDDILITHLLDVPAVTIYGRSYSSSEEGLRAYVHYAAKTQNANIVVKQLNGDGWYAADSENISTVSASTYKLFVAKILFDKMNRGETSWNDSILDTDVDTCFDRMTIASTNPCAQEWLNRWGRSTVNQTIWNMGFSKGTTFTDPEAVHTTAADLAKYMTGLEDGSLVSGDQRTRLLTSLSTHPYRYGVPTGSSGKVWDKVGFLWDYVHDAAIVHHPRGKYVIVVMTKGRSYATIADITRQIERIMYP